MKEITLGGYSLEALKKTQQEVRKDAAKFLAVNQEEVVLKLSNLVEMQGDDRDDGSDVDWEAVNKLAGEIIEQLKAIELVAGISGMEYCLPYSDDYGDGDAYSYSVENSNLHESDVVFELIDQLGGMEHQSYLWNSSSAQC